MICRLLKAGICFSKFLEEYLVTLKKQNDLYSFLMINHDTKQEDVSENSVKNIGSYLYAWVLDVLTNTHTNSWKLLHIDMI